MSKSHVSMAQNQCFTCPKTYDTGEILLDKHLRPRFEMHTVVGYGICPTCTKEYLDKGRIALVKAMQLSTGVKLLGAVMWLKADAWDKIFTMPPPPNGIAFVDPQAFDALRDKVPKD